GCPSGTIFGVTSSGSVSGISIRNGTVQGFTLGIATGNLIEKITAQANGFGIAAGDKAIVRDSCAFNNTGRGIDAGAAAIVSDCIASGNGGIGIAVISGTVRNSVAINNTFSGIVVDNPDNNAPTGGATIIGNTASNNGQSGFLIGDRISGTVTANTA